MMKIQILIMKLLALLLILNSVEEIMSSKSRLQIAVKLMSQLPDGNLTNLVILQQMKFELDEDVFEEVSILDNTMYDITVRKIYLNLRY